MHIKQAVLFLFILLSAGLSTDVQGTGVRHPDSGLYALWYGQREQILDLPYLKGGQIVVQWRELEPQPGAYDFAPIERRLKTLHEKGLRTTIQINGNQKPGWLYEKVPYHPEKFSVQVRREPGTLMYWHPVHQTALQNLLINFARFLEGIEERETLIGIRLNFNAIGTEHFHVPRHAQALDQWVEPEGVEQGPPWSDAIVAAYQDAIVDTYVKYLAPHALIFVRNSIHPDLDARFRPLIRSGKLGWFHTSSEKEPKARFHENQYKRFYEDARPGYTLAYAEPWASAWGDHGIKTDNRVSSPPQWNYWRLLLDLHTGVSFIGLYYHDIEVAASGVYPKYNDNYYNEAVDGLGYQRQFEEAFRFAEKYAGYHNAPTTAPGAWVAFRQNDFSLANNVDDQSSRRLTWLTGDYNFLMERLPDASKGAVGVGPRNQREGAFARILPAGETMRLVPNSAFLNSLEGARIRVTYFDDSAVDGASFTLQYGDTLQTVALEGSGNWRTAEWTVGKGDLTAAPLAGELRLTAGPQPLHLHMLEVLRRSP